MDSLTYPNCNLVLRKFMTVCNETPDQLEDNLASNAVFEWFGRTFKHKKKICDFVTHNHNEDFDQIFTQVQSCEPFEVRDTHLSTRTTPPENYIWEPEVLIPSQPSLVEELETEKIILEEQKTPPRTRKQNNSPPPTPVVPWKKYIDLSDDDLEPGPSSTNSTSSSTPEAPKSKRQCHESIECSQNLEKDQYSSLLYLKASGSTRVTSQKVKSRVYVSPPSADLLLTPQPISHEDNDCMLSISYRVHQQTEEIQFALMIYEPLIKNIKSRRNLEKEFEEHATNSTQKSNIRKPKASTSATKNEDQPTRKIERKRNLRF